MKKEQVFSRLWDAYSKQNPSVKAIFNSFTELGEVVKNDHIALRTFSDSRVDIEVLAKPFEEVGYVEVGEYYFEQKKLKAKHFEIPDDPNQPKVFISQLQLDDFSMTLQDHIMILLNSVDDKVYQDPDLVYKGNVWIKPSYKVYKRLKSESEYAAWLYVFGFCANHFTISINQLEQFNTIEKVNDFVKSKGFSLNASGGEIKGSKEELLQQSSTMAKDVHVSFIEGEYSIPGCYYEFAIRYPDTEGKLYNGFIAKSADKIFESTNKSHTYLKP